MQPNARARQGIDESIGEAGRAEAVHQHIDAHASLRRCNQARLQLPAHLVLEQDEGFQQNFAARLIDGRKSPGKESLAAFESSPKKFRYFCSVCGSPIYSHGEKTAQVVSVRCGTLKQDPGMRAAYHAFVGSKASWVDIHDAEPQFTEWADAELVKQLFTKRNGA